MKKMVKVVFRWARAYLSGKTPVLKHTEAASYRLEWPSSGLSILEKAIQYSATYRYPSLSILWLEQLELKLQQFLKKNFNLKVIFFSIYR